MFKNSINKSREHFWLGVYFKFLIFVFSNYIYLIFHFPNFRAQFAENRSIFNTPNPRLMNVTLLKETKDGRHHRSTKKKKLSRNMSINEEGKALSHHLGISYYVNLLGCLCSNGFQLREHSHMTSDVFGYFWPTYPNQILYYISLFSIKSDDAWLTYLPKNLTSYVNAT